MVSGAVIALVCAVLAFGLWRLLRRLIRNQSSHTGLGHTAPAVVPQAASEPQAKPEPQAVPEPVVLAEVAAEPAPEPVEPVVEVLAQPQAEPEVVEHPEPVVVAEVAAEPAHEPAEPVVEAEAQPQAEPEVAVSDPSAEQPEGPWVMELIDLEPGQGVLCARTSREKCADFEAARSRITGEFGLFSLGKINVDAVRKKECMVMLVSDLADLETNERIQQAHQFGVPVVLVSDLLAAQHPDRVRAHFAPVRATEYRQARGAFQAHWSESSLELSAGMRYFLTHSNAGCSLLTEEGEYLNALIGPRLTLKGEVPEDQEVDMVVVPTLRTTSKKYLQVIERQRPVLVVKAEDIRHAALGDQVPAWRWHGGSYFQYPALERKA